MSATAPLELPHHGSCRTVMIRGVLTSLIETALVTGLLVLQAISDIAPTRASSRVRMRWRFTILFSMQVIELTL